MTKREETPAETSVRLDKKAVQERTLNKEVQQYIIETLPACGIHIFEITREMWDYPALTVTFHDGDVVKEVTVNLNGYDDWAEITHSARKDELARNGSPYLRRFLTEEVGVRCQRSRHDEAASLEGNP